jgi:hypothetical protein
MARARPGLIAVALAVLTAGCGIAHPTELNYRTDTRLDFLEPEARSLIKPPVTVRWTIRDFTVQAPGSAPPQRDAGYFAVFVDKAPIKPDETMRVIAKNDQVCLHRPGCPDKEYLEDRQIFTTTASSLTLEQIPQLSGNKERIQFHLVTVILLDTAGHRIGEAAWQLDFRMRRAGL